MPTRRVRLSLLAALCAAVVALAGCGAASREPMAIVLPASIRLSTQERDVWAPLPATRDGIPVLLYHGIGEAKDFDSAADAAYGVTQPNFAKQMALLKAAGYETITLAQFRAFVAGAKVELPPHPLLLTFDDGLQSSFEGAEPVLRELGWNAVMFVDVGNVDERTDGYASWDRIAEAQASGRWQVQLHAGRGHHNIVYDAKGTTGPFYAYRDLRTESFAAWRQRVVEDVEWGEAQLRKHVPGYRAESFAPPYGNYGQVASDDPLIPQFLGDWLRAHYGYVFVQDPAHYAEPGEQVVPRLQITRKMTGGDLHDWLQSELP